MLCALCEEWIPLNSFQMVAQLSRHHLLNNSYFLYFLRVQLRAKHSQLSSAFMDFSLGFPRKVINLFVKASGVDISYSVWDYYYVLRDSDTCFPSICGCLPWQQDSFPTKKPHKNPVCLMCSHGLQLSHQPQPLASRELSKYLMAC